MLTPKEKEKIVAEHKIHEKDTGSSEVQIGLLTEEIDRLLAHLKQHPKDLHSKRGLLRMVAKRRKLLSYLKEENVRRYNALAKKIGIVKEK
ncbi:MAG: 30S ribosomal protein S15 [bacterium]